MALGLLPMQLGWRQNILSWPLSCILIIQSRVYARPKHEAKAQHFSPKRREVHHGRRNIIFCCSNLKKKVLCLWGNGQSLTSSSFEAWPSDSPACAQHKALCFWLILSATHVRVLMNADGEGLAPKNTMLKFKLVMCLGIFFF